MKGDQNKVLVVVKTVKMAYTSKIDRMLSPAELSSFAGESPLGPNHGNTNFSCHILIIETVL